MYNGLTYEEMMNGHTKLRNKAIANILNQMGFVESWGTGIQKIKKPQWHMDCQNQSFKYMTAWCASIYTANRFLQKYS